MSMYDDLFKNTVPSSLAKIHAAFGQFEENDLTIAQPDLSSLDEKKLELRVLNHTANARDFERTFLSPFVWSDISPEGRVGRGLPLQGDLRGFDIYCFHAATLEENLRVAPDLLRFCGLKIYRFDDGYMPLVLCTPNLGVASRSLLGFAKSLIFSGAVLRLVQQQRVDGYDQYTFEQIAAEQAASVVRVVVSNLHEWLDRHDMQFRGEEVILPACWRLFHFGRTAGGDLIDEVIAKEMYNQFSQESFVTADVAKILQAQEDVKRALNDEEDRLAALPHDSVIGTEPDVGTSTGEVIARLKLKDPKDYSPFERAYHRWRVVMAG